MEWSIGTRRPHVKKTRVNHTSFKRPRQSISPAMPGFFLVTALQGAATIDRRKMRPWTKLSSGALELGFSHRFGHAVEPPSISPLGLRDKSLLEAHAGCLSRMVVCRIPPHRWETALFSRLQARCTGAPPVQLA